VEGPLELHQRAEKEEALENYGAAESLYREAATALFEMRPEDEASYATILNNLAVVQRKMGKHEEALTNLAMALRLRRRVLAPNDPLIPETLGATAVVLQETKRYAEAEPILVERLALMGGASVAPSAGVAQALHDVAEVSERLGKHSVAESHYKAALGMDRVAPDSDPGKVGRDLNNLAFLYRKMGRADDAATLFQESFRTLSEKYGESDDVTLKALENLGDLRSALKQFPQAASCYHRIVDIRRRALGTDDPKTIASLEDLANWYREHGQTEQAEPLFREAVQSKKRNAGGAYPALGADLGTLASICKGLRRYQEAERLYEEAIEVVRSTQGERTGAYAASLNNLATLKFAMGDVASAEPLTAQAAEVMRVVYGEYHPNRLQLLLNLQMLYSRLDKVAEAVVLDETINRIRERQTRK
jgi:tetratricopeptide (TPR) repeat protein